MDKVNGKNASELTHLIKELGGGSMPNGLAKLLKDSVDKIKLEETLTKIKTSSNIKTGIIFGLSAGLILQTLERAGILSFDNKNEHANNVSQNDIEKAIKAVESLSEEEAEELIEESLIELENKTQGGEEKNA